MMFYAYDVLQLILVVLRSASITLPVRRKMAWANVSVHKFVPVFWHLFVDLMEMFMTTCA